MPTQNQLGWDLANMLQLNEINRPDKDNRVFDQSGGKNILDWIITQNAKARQTTGKDGLFEVPIIGDTNRVAQVKTGGNTLVGSDLKVEFVDTSYDLFRVGEVLIDGSAGNYTGRVISKGLGYVILKAAPGVTWSTATHFVAGTYVTDSHVGSPDRRTSGPTSLFSVPFFKQFRTSKITESLTLYENDFMGSYVNPTTGMYAPKAVEYMMERIANAKEMKAIFSKFGSQLEQDGQVQYSSGFMEAVKDAETGGIYRPMGNVPTYDDFTEFAGAIADRRGETKPKLNFLLGRKMLGVIQTFDKISEQVKNVGIGNTFGGVEVKGYDVYNYSFEGITCEFMLLPSLNNVRKFPAASTISGTSGTRMQYTMMCVDFEQRKTRDNDIVPAVEKVYFGSKEETMGVVRGSLASFAIGDAAAQQGLIIGANSSNGVTLDYESNCAYRWLPYYGGLMELTS